MKNLLRKEWKLALHPTTVIFWALSLMAFIPAYPYEVIFFYTALGLFFVCLSGRENHDIAYTLYLPVSKTALVRARILFAVMVELIQMATLVVAVVLRAMVAPGPNPAGMDANTVLFAHGFLMLGVFHIVFFTRYYRAPDAVGKAFVWSSVAMFALLVVLETVTFAVPFVRDVLDTPDPANLGVKLAVLAACACVYALLTLVACRSAERSFAALDL